ncbi:hypothetical protein SCLCIDRAFT_610523 [Scleroderma citrinum Foug A]|uniref:Electron transfer flavoprotein-ubiquinone oxidoreductase n=1 Tax=Scleroderma citrinum Foug A TaxID=1036808 RepID=A0A0C3E9I7_9AGAM|nr:hypothetical protein SCLCIDRAFT_610523 [Scleroderma citrinum Foug A]
MLACTRRLVVAPRTLRTLHVSTVRRRELFDPFAVERISEDVDVCIVGGGPAGLSAAIRLKQLEQERGKEFRVVVLEKGAEVGSHILSGAVVEPRALNELLPDWSSRADHPLKQPATSSSMKFLTSSLAIPIPHPPQMSNKGNYITSLSQFTSWLGSIAEELGVEVYPGFAGAGIVYSEDGKSVLGVRTNEVGLDKKFRMKETFEPGMEFRAKITLIAEGAHGSLSKELINKFDLRRDTDPQTYAIGLKEVWRVDPSQYRPGEVVHTLGWPLDWKTYGGGWVYHMADGLVSLGLAIGLDYANPWLSPYNELQRMKHHPYFTRLLSGSSTRIAYGARSLNEGGLQAVPRLHFPGGALIGCSAGFVNIAKIKGTHNAMKSGMLAAEALANVLCSDGEEHADAESGSSRPSDMSAYEKSLKESWVWSDLHEGRTPWTFRNKSRTSDAAHTLPASRCKPIIYPPPQPPLSTDLLTSLALTGTNHAEDQPVHLRVRAGGVEDAYVRREHVKRNVGEFGGLLGRACPAGVYEYVDDESATDSQEGQEEGWDGKKLVINSQNCIHCKLCDIKVPTQDITWTVPEGGGGPKYTIT